MKRLKTILLTLVVILCIFAGLWIAQDNPQPVALRLLGFPVGEIPVGLGLLVVLALGALLGLIASGPTILRLRAENRRLKQNIEH